jgi:hypothetical protein
MTRPRRKANANKTNYKATTQAFATPMTGVEAFEAGRREYRRYSGGAGGRPQRASITMRTKHGEARPHLFTKKRRRSKGRVSRSTNQYSAALNRTEDAPPA